MSNPSLIKPRDSIFVSLDFFPHVRQSGLLRKIGLLTLIALLCGQVLPAAQKAEAEKTPKLPTLEILERAHTEFAQGDYARARQNFLKVLPSYPDNFELLKDLATCYFIMGPRSYREAAKYYERAYKVNSRSGEVATKLSQCYLGLKKYQKAATLDERMARLAGAAAEYWKRAAEAYDAAKDRPNARQAYIVYLERKPRDLLARCNLARIDGLNKNYKWAAGQYRRVLSDNPNFIPALVGLAQVYSWQGQQDKSIELFNRVLERQPENSEALTGKAFALLWEKDYRQSYEIFEYLQHRYPGDAEAKHGLIESQSGIKSNAISAAQKNGNVSELLDYYQREVVKDPQDTDTSQALTSFSAGTNHCKESKAFGSKTLKDSKGSPTGLLAVARSLRVCGNNSEAVAVYRKYLQAHPGSKNVLYELADTLRREKQFPESRRIFRQLVQSDPSNTDAQVGLGQTLAAAGQYDAALARFDHVLREHPGYYDALQGKAYVLFWKGNFNAARTIFEVLKKRNSHDPQNSEALREIARAEEAAHWKVLRPEVGASAQSWADYYQKRLQSYPNDLDAMKGLAYEESHLNHQKAAIRAYRHVLEAYPDDHDAKVALARLLSLDHQYPAAIDLYRQALQQTPKDTTVQASLARVYFWSGQPQRALESYQRLLLHDPSNTTYLLAASQLAIQLKKYSTARESLGSVLAVDPANQRALLEMAQLDTAQGQYDTALEDYDVLLKHDPQNPAALLAKARISFYQGNLPAAHTAVTEAMRKRPDDFSSVFLLASIEHAQHHRRKALQLLKQAEKLSPDNAQVASLQNRLLSESRVTLSTTAAFAREIGPPSQTSSGTGLPNEDLRTYTYGTTIGINLFPRTNSYFSFTSVPTDSPPGPLRDSQGNQIPTGITGATAPYEFLYRQSTRLGHWLTLRGGAGFVRFSPGSVVSIPGRSVPVKAAGQRPIGQAGVSFELTRKLTLDFDATKSAITYTPVSTRLGVIRDRLQGRINYFFNPQTKFHLAYWYGRYSTEDYTHTPVVNGIPQSYVQADRNEGQGGSIIFNREILHSSGFSLDAGYEGYIFGFAGQGQNLFLGFYNPSFYQRHEFVPRIYGSLWGPLGYDFSGGIGIQQTGFGKAITRAWDFSPSFSVQVDRHLRLVFGYTYYNSAQALGPLRGNEVRFGTEWKY